MWTPPKCIVPYIIAECLQSAVQSEGVFDKRLAHCHNTDAYPILWTYNVIKTRFGTEPYPSVVKYIKFRVAISKLRTSSHALAIEQGRYANPRTPVHERLCHSCRKIEDEYQNVMECKANCDFREMFLNKLKDRSRNFAALSQRKQCVYIFTNEDKCR